MLAKGERNDQAGGKGEDFSSDCKGPGESKRCGEIQKAVSTGWSCRGKSSSGFSALLNMTLVSWKVDRDRLKPQHLDPEVVSEFDLAGVGSSLDQSLQSGVLHSLTKGLFERNPPNSLF